MLVMSWSCGTYSIGPSQIYDSQNWWKAKVYSVKGNFAQESLPKLRKPGKERTNVKTLNEPN
jgi:hypothetical protein